MRQFSDREVLENLLQILDGRNIQLGTKVGTKIGTAATQKLGLWGASPVVQAASISTPSGGATIDTQSRTAITAIITALHNAGIIA